MTRSPRDYCCFEESTGLDGRIHPCHRCHRAVIHEGYRESGLCLHHGARKEGTVINQQRVVA